MSIFISYFRGKNRAESFFPFRICTKQMHIVSGKGWQLFQKVRKEEKRKILLEKNINNTENSFI